MAVVHPETRVEDWQLLHNKQENVWEEPVEKPTILVAVWNALMNKQEHV